MITVMVLLMAISHALNWRRKKELYKGRILNDVVSDSLRSRLHTSPNGGKRLQPHSNNNNSGEFPFLCTEA